MNSAQVLSTHWKWPSRKANCSDLSKTTEAALSKMFYLKVVVTLLVIGVGLFWTNQVNVAVTEEEHMKATEKREIWMGSLGVMPILIGMWMVLVVLWFHKPTMDCLMHRGVKGLLGEVRKN